MIIGQRKRKPVVFPVSLVTLNLFSISAPTVRIDSSGVLSHIADLITSLGTGQTQASYSANVFSFIVIGVN